MNNERGFTLLEGLICFMILTIIVGGIASVFIKNNWDRHQQTLHVQKAERVTDQDGRTSRYLIFADEGTYENTDSWLNGKFNSSDIYGQVKAGKTYKCLVYGWRIPFFSQYPNIVSCEEVKS